MLAKLASSSIRIDWCVCAYIFPQKLLSKPLMLYTSIKPFIMFFVCDQAERQAVNTTVQGSAADLVKLAMVRIDEELMKVYPDTTKAHRHKFTGEYP